MSSTCDVLDSMSAPPWNGSHLKGYWMPLCATFLNLEHERQVWSQAQERHAGTRQRKHGATQTMRAPWQYDGPIECMATYLERSKAAYHSRNDEKTGRHRRGRKLKIKLVDGEKNEGKRKCLRLALWSRFTDMGSRKEEEKMLLRKATLRLYKHQLSGRVMCGIT